MQLKGVLLAVFVIAAVYGFFAVGVGSGHGLLFDRIAFQGGAEVIIEHDNARIYLPDEELSGSVDIRFSSLDDVPDGSLLRAYIDGGIISNIDLSDRIPEPGDYEYKTYDFSYEITAGIHAEWTEYPEQDFSYALKLDYDCGNEQCAPEGICECPCDVPTGSPYTCHYSTTFFESSSQAGSVKANDNNDGIKKIYDKSDYDFSVIAPDYDPESVVWKVKCGDGEYRRKCETALGNSDVQLFMGGPGESSGYLDKLWVTKPLNPSAWGICTSDTHSYCEDGRGDVCTMEFDTFYDASLEQGFTAYGGPIETEGGGIFRNGVYQGSPDDVFWDGWYLIETGGDEETEPTVTKSMVGLIIINGHNYDSGADYKVSYLPANGPVLWAYTDHTVSGSEDEELSAEVSGQCSYGSDYTATYNNDEIQDLLGVSYEEEYCSGREECSYDETYGVAETSDPDNVVEVSYDTLTPPITVTAHTESAILNDFYTIQGIGFGEFSGLAAGPGEHTLKFRIEHGSEIKGQGSVTFTVCEDADSDGYCSVDEGGEDCDDDSDEIYPGAQELCDGIDNDCDGEVDEDYAVGGECHETPDGFSDGASETSICNGVFVCSEDGLDVVCDNGVSPGDSDEICDNGIDDDCDGEVDEDGITIDDEWQTCITLYECEEGDVVTCGQCRIKGYSVCINGEWSECFGDQKPETEVCNKIDDNCDGIIDNINDGASVEETGCWCYNGRQPRSESVEPCNDIDDDCDGEVDEGVTCCAPGDTRECGTNVGECEKGVQTCMADGSWGSQCSGGVRPVEEICYNGKDEDCDGEVDEEPWCRPEFTCFNGMLDVNEEGVDCGGVCAQPCENFSSWLLLGVILIGVIGIFLAFQIRIAK